MIYYLALISGVYGMAITAIILHDRSHAMD